MSSTLDFQDLLSQRLPAWARSEGDWYDQASGDARERIVIYGFGDLGRKLLRGLRKIGLEPLGIVDAKLAATNSVVENLPCVSVREGASRWGNDAVFVVAVFNQSGGRAFSV